MGASAGVPTLGITMGDPAGIGPEVVRAALASGRLDPNYHYRIFGDVEGIVPGRPDAHSARVALRALEEAVALARDGTLAAVVTGPVAKARMHEIGFAFPGQTEFFAARCHVRDFAMLLTGGALTVALVTVHVPLADVPGLLTRAEIVRVGKLLAAFVQRRTGRIARVAVAGLNPHAGESGMLGREEIEIIAPALTTLGETLEGSATFTGPVSPDTVFYRAVRGEFDAVLCMYHDQGLIPLKLHAFEQGVNLTLGLPFPRTSPDHGTAFELAAKGGASAASMIAAINLAAELATKQIVWP
ncbi:MAG TPA: 4-hydroxythreonine-4-phosphate dehydrogenase PdxA [Chthoniobacteraceae bacterium]|nr:4-hydroxythreonine-4-phosphate dehydrogenase PdxA [Chthoniobacteraceae bacterium]